MEGLETIISSPRRAGKTTKLNMALKIMEILHISATEASIIVLKLDEAGLEIKPKGDNL